MYNFMMIILLLRKQMYSSSSSNSNSNSSSTVSRQKSLILFYFYYLAFLIPATTALTLCEFWNQLGVAQIDCTTPPPPLGQLTAIKTITVKTRKTTTRTTELPKVPVTTYPGKIKKKIIFCF